MVPTAPRIRSGSSESLPVKPLIGSAPCVSALRSTIAVLGRRNCTVLLHGESGSGKELVAQHIHAAGPRAAGPFVAVDCTVLRDTLFESQLFGHVKGSFTGAEQATLGFFRAADGGTLFLDEIGELEPHVQAKLLRCIQDSAVVPLGAVQPVSVDVRIIAASHRDLRAMVRGGKFREDLFFRLNVVQLEVPPLRSRRQDIIELAQGFLRQQAALYQEPLRELAPDAAAALTAHDWPGNVRELANAIEHACAFAERGVITVADLPGDVRAAAQDLPAASEDATITLETAERAAITRALRASGGNRARAAQLLQIERHRLYRKIRRYRLEHLSSAILA